jgi:hypothetical protein
MTQRQTRPGTPQRHVSLVGLPDAAVSTLFGIFDVMNAHAVMDASNAGAPPPSAYRRRFRIPDFARPRTGKRR